MALPRGGRTLLVVALLAAPAAGEAVAQDPPTTDLRVRLSASPRPGAAVERWTVRCRPSGGTWKDRGVCGRLARDASALDPILREAKDSGPITATPLRITGTVAGRRVDVRIPARGSSTRRRRLRELKVLLGPDAYRAAQRSVRG